MVAPARKGKPTAAAETARVMSIFHWIMDDLNNTRLSVVPVVVGKEPPVVYPSPMPAAVLAVADHIAARTED